MRVKTYSRLLRTTTYIVLFFFIWTFGPIYEIVAFAATPQGQGSTSKGQGKAAGPSQSAPDTSGSRDSGFSAAERFENAIAKLRASIDKEDAAEVQKRRAEIDSIDVDLRKEFSATEKKLKDAKLPREILDRHYKFVKHYDDNLKELRGNLDDIDKAGTGSDRKAKIEKARLHLEKIKLPKKHKPFNPDRLPSRTREIKQVQISLLNRVFDWLVPSADASEPPPSSADLAETLETPQTQEIHDLAQKLGGTSVSLYEYVRNVYTYEPYAGSTKGAVQTLREKSGNEWDQASLLIALYRASGIPARYAVGSVEISIDKVMNWLGVEDPRMAGNLLSTLGKSASVVTVGGRITALRFQHVWVRAYVPFIYSRGATNGPGDMWVDVDPSFKAQTITKTLTINEVSVFDQLEYLSTFRTASPFDYYKSQLQTFLDANNPGYVPEALARGNEITPERFGVLIGQPPYIIKSVIGTYSEIPNTYRQKFTLSLTDPATGENLLYYSAPLPQIIGKRMTLSYIPATDADQTVITNYGGLYSTPPYLVKLKPEIKIDGTSTVQGNAIGSGQEQNLEFVFDTTIDQGRVENVIIAGGYYAIGLSARAGDTRENILECTNQLAQLAGTIDFNDPSTLDQKLGEILYLSAVVYHQNLDSITKKIAALDHVVDVRDISEMMYFLTLKVNSAFGVPIQITPAGITGDMDRNLHTVVPVDGDVNRIKAFMLLVSTESSYLEHDVTEKIYQIQAVSSVKGIQLAHDQGISVHTINSQNISTELPMLQLSEELKADITNAVNTGQEVIVPERNLTLGDWRGIGYIVQNPTNGKGAYLISGGYGGTATIDSAATEDKFHAAISNIASELELGTIKQTIRYPGQDNKIGTDDDVVFHEVSLREISFDEKISCGSKDASPPCSKRYEVSHAEVAQPLIDTQEHAGAQLTKHIAVGDWKSTDNARYMRAGKAVLVMAENMAGYFELIKGGDWTPGVISGYRSTTANNAAKVNGAASLSHHRDGVAADTYVSGSTIPPKCQILHEAKCLAGDFAEILGELNSDTAEPKTTVHIAVPAMHPHTDQNYNSDGADQWECGTWDCNGGSNE